MFVLLLPLSRNGASAGPPGTTGLMPRLPEPLHSGTSGGLAPNATYPGTVTNRSAPVSKSPFMMAGLRLTLSITRLASPPADTVAEMRSVAVGVVAVKETSTWYQGLALPTGSTGPPEAQTVVPLIAI